MTDEVPVRAGHEDIRRGFVWLGAASVVGRILDAGGVLIVMWFVTREQLGLATLAWSVAVFLEAMNGMGLGTALLQSREMPEERLTGAFWYTMSLATLLVAVVAVLSPWIASWFGQPALAPMIVVSTTKVWFVGAALVPLNQLNRATRFERIAAVGTFATFGSGVITCTLAVLGFQAWALVLGQTSHGLLTAIGANIAHPYSPRGKFKLAAIRSDIVFGAKVASAQLLYHFYRNADYYLIGRILGVSAVGLYRVAFDLAMAPTLAVLAVVNRSALPVYARLSDRPKEVLDAFLWTLRSLGVLLAPITALLLFAADDLLASVNHGQWLDAAPMVRWLSVAALLRCFAQTFPQLFHAMRRPTLAVYDSLLTMVLLLSFLALGLSQWGAEYGPLVAAWAWTALYPITLLVLFVMAQQLIPLRAHDLRETLRHPVGALLSMGLAQAAFVLALRSRLPSWLSPWVSVACLSLAFVAYVRWGMGITLKGLSAKNRPATPAKTEEAAAEAG